jgi:hypothetical protein
VKGIEEEGKAEFKIFGKKHTLSFGEFLNWAIHPMIIPSLTIARSRQT